MDLKSQICDLEYAQQLDELGVSVNSFWWWAKHPMNSYDYGILVTDTDCTDKRFEWVKHAYTSSELGKILPYRLKTGVIAGKTRIDYLYVSKGFNDFSCFYAMNNGQTRLWIKNANTLANALAKMLVYLIKEKLITISDINNVL